MTEVIVPTVSTVVPQPEPSEAIREAVQRAHLNPVTACLVDGQLVETEPVRAWKTSDGQLFQHREDADAHVEEIVRQNRERAEKEIRERRLDVVLEVLKPAWCKLMRENGDKNYFMPGDVARWIVDHRDALLEALS